MRCRYDEEVEKLSKEAGAGRVLIRERRIYARAREFLSSRATNIVVIKLMKVVLVTSSLYFVCSAANNVDVVIMLLKIVLLIVS